VRVRVQVRVGVRVSVSLSIMELFYHRAKRRVMVSTQLAMCIRSVNHSLDNTISPRLSIIISKTKSARL